MATVLNKLLLTVSTADRIGHFLFKKRRESGKSKGESLRKEDHDAIAESAARELEGHFRYIFRHLKRGERELLQKFIYQNKSILNSKQNPLVRKGILIEKEGSLKISLLLFENFLRDMPIIVGREDESIDMRIIRDEESPQQKESTINSEEKAPPHISITGDRL